MPVGAESFSSESPWEEDEWRCQQLSKWCCSHAGLLLVRLRPYSMLFVCDFMLNTPFSAIAFCPRTQTLLTMYSFSILHQQQQADVLLLPMQGCLWVVFVCQGVSFSPFRASRLCGFHKLDKSTTCLQFFYLQLVTTSHVVLHDLLSVAQKAQ